MLVLLLMVSAVLAMARGIHLIDWSWWVIWLPASCAGLMVLGALLFSIFTIFFVDPFKVSYR